MADTPDNLGVIPLPPGGTPPDPEKLAANVESSRIAATQHPYSERMYTLGGSDSVPDPSPTEDPSKNLFPVHARPTTPAQRSYAEIAQGLRRRQAQDTELREQFATWRAANDNVSPDRAAGIALMSASTGTSSQYIADHYDEVKARFDENELYTDLQSRPELMKMIMDASKAPLVKDDAAALGGIEWLLTGKWEYIPGVEVPYYDPLSGVQVGTQNLSHQIQRSGTGAIWEGAWAQQRIALLSARQVHNTNTSEDDKELEELEAKYNNRDYVGAQEGDGAGPWLRHQVAAAWAGTVGLLPYTGMAAIAIGGGAKLGAAAGALFGAPAAGAGAAPGAAIGGAIGGYVAGTAFNYMQQVGPLYRNLRRLKHGDGSPVLTEDEAKNYAIATSLATSAVTSLAGAKLVGSVPGVKRYLDSAMGKGVERALVKATAGQAVMNAFEQWSAHEIAGATLMGVTAGANQAAMELAKHQHGEVGTFNAVADATAEGVISGLRDVAILGAWEPGRRMMYDLGVAAKGRQYAQEIRAEIDAAQNSKFFKRAPEEAAKFADKIAQQQPELSNRYVDMEAWNKHWTAAGEDPRRVMAHVIGDNGETYDAAIAEGGPIPVPVGAFLARLAQTEHGLALANDVTKDPNVPTPNQQKLLDKQLEAAADAAATDEYKATYDRIYEREAKRATSSGVEKAVAEEYAKLRVQNIVAFASRDPYKRSLAEWDRRIGDLGVVGPEGKGTKVDVGTATILDQRAMDRELASVMMEAGRVEPNALDGKDVMRRTLLSRIDVAERRSKEQVGTTGWMAGFYQEDASKARMLLKYLDGLKPSELQKIFEGKTETEGGVFRLDQVAWHGTPKSEPFEAFDAKYLFSGEGGAAFGVGHYFAEEPKVSKRYRDVLAGEPDVLLNGRKPKDYAPGSTEERLIVDAANMYRKGLRGSATILNAMIREVKDEIIATFERVKTRDDLEGVDITLKDLRMKLKYLESIKPTALKVKTAGALYKVDIPEKTDLIDYNARLADQDPAVLAKLQPVVNHLRDMLNSEGSLSWEKAGTMRGPDDWTGADLYVAAGSLSAKKLGVYVSGSELDRMASEYLRGLGVPGMMYLDQYSRAGGPREFAPTHNFVIWDDASIRILARLKQENRGFVEFAAGGDKAAVLKANINRLVGADRSTLAHESAHFFVESMSRIVESEFAYPELQKDFQQLLDFMGYRDNAQRRTQQQERARLTEKAALSKVPLNPIERSQLKLLNAKEEKLAYAWETYLAEGKAPAPELVSTFRRFKNWMLEIYKSIQGIAEVYKKHYGRELNISDEVRKVFDRLITADKEIDIVDPEPRDKQPLPDALKEAMTPTEAAEHKALGASRRERAKEQLTATMAKDDKRTESQAAIAARERATAQAAKEINAQPEYQILANLEASPVRLSKTKVVHEFGKPALEVLPDSVWAPRGGASADEAAVALGADSGPELLDSLSRATNRDAAIKSRVQKILGKSLREDPTRLRDAANEAVNNDDKAKEVSIERAAYNRQLPPKEKKAPISLQAAEKSARAIIMGKTISQIRPNIWALNERSAADRAYRAAVAGDLATARDFKDAQILNMYLAKVGKIVLEELNKARAELEAMNSGKERAAINRASPLLAGYFGALMEAAGIQEAAQLNEIKDLATLQSFVEGKGQEILFNKEVIGALLANPKQWGQLKYSEAEAVHTAAASLQVFADSLVRTTLEGKKITYDDLLARWTTEVDKIAPPSGPPGGPPNQPPGGPVQPPGPPEITGLQPPDRAALSLVQRVKLLGQAIDGMLLDPNTQLYMAGKTLHQYIFKEGYLNALYLENKISKDIAQYFKAAWGQMPKELQAIRYEVLNLKHDLPIPADAGLNSGPTTRQWLWGIALSQGTAKGRELTERTMGWSERTVAQVIKKYLSPLELKFLQDTLDLTGNKLKPLVDAKNEKKTGVKTQKLERSPLTLDGETLLEGWFPTRFDRREGVGRPGDAGFLYDRDYVRATEEGESGYTRIPNFAWEIVPAHIAQVVHDLAFDQFGNEQAMFLMRKDVERLLVRAIGTEKAMQVTAWAQTIMNENARSIARENQRVAGAMGYLRSAAVYGGVGYSLSVAVSNFSDLGVAWMSGAAGNMARAIPNFIDVAVRYPWLRGKYLDMIPMLQHRDMNWKREMRDRMGDVGTGGKKVPYIGRGLDVVKGGAFGFLEAMDKFTSTILAVTRYRDEIAKHGDHAKAVDAAADAVMIGGGPTQTMGMMAPILRDKGFIGSLLIFHGYFNRLYNIKRRLQFDVRLARLEAENPTEYLGALGKTAINAGRWLGVLGFATLFGELLAGRGRDEDEDWSTWMKRKMLAAPFSPYPFIGNITEAAADKFITGKTHGGSIRQAPVLGVAQNILETTGKLFQENRDNQDKAYDIAEQIAQLAHLPAHQLRRTGGFWGDVMTNRVSPQTPGDYVAGTVYGKRQRQPKNIADLIEEMTR